MENLNENFINQMWDDIKKMEKEIIEHNTDVIKKIGHSALKNYTDLVEDVNVIGKIELVRNPRGAFQSGEEYGDFKKVYVEQHCTNEAGDSFAGHIYTNYGETEFWIKIPFEC